MSIAKIIELSSESIESFEDAIETGIQRAESTIKNIKGAWISEQKVVVQEGHIIKYRVVMRVTFILE